MNHDNSATMEDVSSWFLEKYLPEWVANAAAAEPDPRTILKYWGAPLYASSVNMTKCLLTDDEVVGLLEANQRPLRALGYTHTKILDHKVVVYNSNAASVDVIWSRRRADEMELERRAVHFMIHRGPDGWRVVALASVLTEQTSLSEVWQESKPANPADLKGSRGQSLGAQA